MLCARCAARVQTIFEGREWLYTFNGLKSHSYVPRLSKGVMRCDRTDRLQAIIEGGLQQEGLRPMTFEQRVATDYFVAAVEVMPRILEDVHVAHDHIVTLCTAHANAHQQVAAGSNQQAVASMVPNYHPMPAPAPPPSMPMLPPPPAPRQPLPRVQAYQGAAAPAPAPPLYPSMFVGAGAGASASTSNPPSWGALLQATATHTPAPAPARTTTAPSTPPRTLGVASSDAAPAPSTPPRALVFASSTSTTSPHMSSSCSAASTESAAAMEVKREMKAEMDDMKAAFHESIGAMRSAFEANAVQMAQLTSTLLHCHEALPPPTPSPPTTLPVVAPAAPPPQPPPVIQGTPIVDLIDYNQDAVDAVAGPEAALGKRRLRRPTRRLCDEDDSE